MLEKTPVGVNAFLSNTTEYAPAMRNAGDAQDEDNLERVLKCLERRISVRNEDGSRLSRDDVEIVGTSPPDDTWRAPLSGLPQGEAHGTREHHIRTIAYPIRICCPDC